MDEDIVVTLKRSNDLLMMFGNDYSDVFLPAIDEIVRLREELQEKLDRAYSNGYTDAYAMGYSEGLKETLYDGMPRRDDRGDNLDGN